jgi:hypothetical protein
MLMALIFELLGHVHLCPDAGNTNTDRKTFEAAEDHLLLPLR